LQAYHAFYHGSGTDDEAAAATDAVKAVAQKIIAVPGTDISIMRLKARVYLWAEDTDPELTWLMQKVIVDTTGALYAAGELILGLRLGFNGVTAATKARRNSSRRVSRSRPGFG
jgi:hypothetical protein